MTREEIFEFIKSKMYKIYSPKLIYIFGSYAWGNPNKDSDIDILVVVNDSELKRMHKRVIKGRKGLIDLDIPKDLLVYTEEEFYNLLKERSSLCYKISEEGLKLYEAA